MGFFPDLGQRSGIIEGAHVRAVGWLHPDQPYQRGPVSEEFRDRLKAFALQSGSSAKALSFGYCMGLHTCEFCRNAHGVANFGVPSGDHLFVCPEMVVHYVEVHEYCPPTEFVAAVLRSPLPIEEEYQLITEPFWHLHRAWAERNFANAPPASSTNLM